MKQYFELCRRPGFSAFLWTQFLGAFNDNAFKIVISMLAIKTKGDSSGAYVSLIGAIFMVPFFCFSGYAGYAADRFNKRILLVITKGIELLAMLIAYVAFVAGQFEWMLVALFIMALHTTFFSTAKYGILPEMLPDKDLSRANGLVEMSTFMAVIAGTAVGGFLFSIWQQQMGTVGLMFIGVAIIGFVTSFRITKVTAAKIKPTFYLNPWAEIGQGFKRLSQNKILLSTVLGISFFGFLGAFLQMDFLLFGSEIMHLDEFSISLLGTFLAIGVGIGSLLAGRLSGDKIELGLVPLGAIGMGLFAVLLSFSGASFSKTALILMLLGTAGGFFSVPLYAMLQHKSDKAERGKLIGTSNFLMTLGVLSASGFLWVFHDFFSIGSDKIILILGLFTLVMTPFIMKIIPQYLIRFSLWMLTHTIFRIKIHGQEHVPFRGPALLVCNHVSYIDGLLVGACVQRFIRFVIHKEYFKIKGLGWLLRKMRAIPDSGGQTQVLELITQGRQALSENHVVCIFAEGAITKTGKTSPFNNEFEGIVMGTDVPIIPVHLEGLWGSVYSNQNGIPLMQRQRKFFIPVSVSFGLPLPSNTSAEEVRGAVMALGNEPYRKEPVLEPVLMKQK